MELGQWLVLVLMVVIAWAHVKLGRWLRRQTQFPIWQRMWWVYILLGVYAWCIVAIVLISLMIGVKP